MSDIELNFLYGNILVLFIKQRAKDKRTNGYICIISTFIMPDYASKLKIQIICFTLNLPLILLKFFTPYQTFFSLQATEVTNVPEKEKEWEKLSPFIGTFMRNE